MGSDYEKFESWYAKETHTWIVKKEFGKRFGLTEDIYFPKPSKEDYAPGYICNGFKFTAPFSKNPTRRDSRVFDERVEGGWRFITKADQLCNPEGKAIKKSM